MAQGIKNFADGLRKGLGIVVHCQCGKHVVMRTSDFVGWISGGEDIEARVWRCTWCGERARFVRYLQLDGLGREDLTRWTPPRR
jgi:hypothetical protein